MRAGTDLSNQVSRVRRQATYGSASAWATRVEGLPAGTVQGSAEAGRASAVAGFGPADDGRRAGFRAYLCVDPVYVVLDRLLGEHEPGGDFAVGVPCRDE